MDVRSFSDPASLGLRILNRGPLARVHFESVAACLAEGENVFLNVCFWL